jgi:MinD-like ATPase involved in chromosome partitioning or flagellar assembly
MYRKGTKHTVGILKRARHLWKDFVFPVEIPNTIEFSRSFEERMPIIMSNPRHPGAQAYMQFARIIHGLPLEPTGVEPPAEEAPDLTETVGEGGRTPGDETMVSEEETSEAISRDVHVS